MPYPRSTKRNKDLVKLRKSDPIKWTFEALGAKFNISRPMAYKIYTKYKNEIE